MYDYRDGEPNRKNLAFFQQGGDPKQGSLDMNDYIIGRVASLYGMSLAGTSDSADGISALRSAIQATQYDHLQQNIEKRRSVGCHNPSLRKPALKPLSRRLQNLDTRRTCDNPLKLSNRQLEAGRTIDSRESASLQAIWYDSRVQIGR